MATLPLIVFIRSLPCLCCSGLPFVFVLLARAATSLTIEWLWEVPRRPSCYRHFAPQTFPFPEHGNIEQRLCGSARLDRTAWTVERHGACSCRPDRLCYLISLPACHSRPDPSRQSPHDVGAGRCGAHPPYRVPEHLPTHILDEQYSSAGWRPARPAESEAGIGERSLQFCCYCKLGPSHTPPRHMMEAHLAHAQWSTTRDQLRVGHHSHSRWL